VEVAFLLALVGLLAVALELVLVGASGAEEEEV